MAGGAAALAWARLKSLGGWSRASAGRQTPSGQGTHRLFPSELQDAGWNRFEAAGFAQPVTGILYRTHAVSYFSSYVDHPRPVSGMPLGGIDTGALYLEASGTLGYSSIFNHLTPVGGPLNTPYLGLSIGGKTWVLTTGQTKNYAGNNRPGLGINLKLLNCDMAETSEYWGHYPIADIEYQNGAPVQVGVRAWSPFIPGDARTSNTPGAIFEVHLRNTTSSRQAGVLAFSFPGFAEHRTRDEVVGWPDLSARPVMPPPQIRRRPVTDGLRGVWVEDKAWGMSYVLAALEAESVRVGGALGTDGLKWAGIEKELPKPGAHDDGGASLAVSFNLEPGQEKVQRLILAWYAPQWEGNGNPGTGGERIITQAPGNVLVPSTTGKRFTHMYASRFANAGEVAEFLARHHHQLLDRILAWQSVVYQEKDLPGWLADALINAFYYFAPCSMWAQAEDPVGNWCKPELGVFSLEEAPRSCPHVSTLSNLAMAGPTLSYFFPECMVSSLAAYRATQKENGDIAQLLGRWSDPANAMAYDYQEVIVGACYVVQVYWHWKIHRDAEFLKDFYPSAKKALEYSFTQRPDLGPAQSIAMPPFRPGTWNDSDWFEDRSYYGYVSDAGAFRLAAAEMLRECAEQVGDTEEVKRMDEFLAAGKETLQKYLWKGDHYLVYYDPQTGKQLDAFFTPELNGQYYAHFAGVPRVLPKENVEKMLALIRDKICKNTRTGMPPTYSNPDGTFWTGNDTGYLTGRYIYNNHQVIWNAITFIYEGQRGFGLELLRKNLELSYCKWGYMWDGTNCCGAGGDTGEVNYGWDYWFNWSIWTAPSALANTDVAALRQPGGFVRRILDAGKNAAAAERTSGQFEARDNSHQ